MPRPAQRSPMFLLWSLPLALALVYALLLVLLWFGQEKLIFLPQKLPADHRFDFGADVHEVWVERPDAVRLHALHLRLPAPRGLVFYLHGNAGSLEGWFVNAEFWRRANYDLFMLDYRGYGKSGGRVQSQAQLFADVRAAWDQVAPGYAGRARVIFGRSLGSALAATLAADLAASGPQSAADLTVLVSPYESLQALAAEIYPWVPAALLRYPLRTDEAVARLSGLGSPLLLLHGERDELIGIGHSERLLARAQSARSAAGTDAQRAAAPDLRLSRLLRLPGAGHNDLQTFPAYLEGLSGALAEVAATAAARPR